MSQRVAGTFTTEDPHSVCVVLTEDEGREGGDIVRVMAFVDERHPNHITVHVTPLPRGGRPTEFPRIRVVIDGVTYADVPAFSPQP